MLGLGVGLGMGVGVGRFWRVSRSSGVVVVLKISVVVVTLFCRICFCGRRAIAWTATSTG